MQLLWWILVLVMIAIGLILLNVFGIFLDFVFERVHILFRRIFPLFLKCPRCACNLSKLKILRGFSSKDSFLFVICPKCQLTIEVKNTVLQIEFPGLRPKVNQAEINKTDFIRLVRVVNILHHHKLKTKGDGKITIDYVPHPVKDSFSNLRYRRILLRGGPHYLRVEAVHILGKSSSRRDIKLLIRMLKDPELQGTIISILEESNANIILPIIRECKASEKDEKMKLLLTHMIEKIGQRKRPHSVDSPLESKNAEVKDAIYWYNKGCEILGIGTEPTQYKAIAFGNNLGEWLGEAISCFDKALEINSRYAEAWTNKAAALFYLGKNQEALKCARKALGINPNLKSAQKTIEKIRYTKI